MAPLKLFLLKFTSTTLSGTSLTLRFLTVLGKTLLIETTGSVPNAQWDLLQTSQGDGTEKSVTITINEMDRFYRLRLVD